MIRILILFANPKKTSVLQTEMEEEVILDSLNLSKYKRKLKLTIVKASTIHDLRRKLLNDDFQIVQISSHGTEQGLILENNEGEPHLVPTAALAELLGKYKSLECLILNACHSISQGILTALNVPITIAMEDTIADQAAIEFSRGFYDAVGAGKNYDFAYIEGCHNVKLCFPMLKFRAEIIKKDELTRETEFVFNEPEKGDELQTFTNIWYAPEKYSFFSVRNPQIGTIYVFEKHLEFKHFDGTLTIEDIIGVKHTKMSGDINNNWVEIIYRKNNKIKSAYFAEASKLGIGNLLGGSDRIFQFLYCHFPDRENESALESDNFRAGNNVTVKGTKNITAGNKLSNNMIINGNIVLKLPEK
jgi:hypothetical protein